MISLSYIHTGAQFLAINLEVPDIHPVASFAKPHLFPLFFGKSHFASWGMSIMPDGQQLSAIARFTTASNSLRSSQMLLTLNVPTTDGKIALFSPVKLSNYAKKETQ